MQQLLSTPRLERFASLMWALVLLTLPITTFRYILGPLGRTLIKPFAFYPLALLLPALLLLALRRRFRLPPNIAPLLAFLLFAMIASLLGAFHTPLELRTLTYNDRVLRGWMSLVIGLLFFLSAFWMNRSERDLRHSLKWLYAGLAATIVWSLVQAIAVNTPLLQRSFVDQIQLLFSERGVQPRRVTGFAFEPAWLADQIVIFYMPWLFAAIITRSPLTSRKWLEPLLFVLSFVVLLFTYSRSGLLGALISILIVSALLGRSFFSRLWSWFSLPLRPKKSGAPRRLPVAIRLSIILILILVVISSFSFLSTYPYFANIWQASRNQSLTNYLIEINIAQRIAYAIAGYQVFERFPLTGVGIGAGALYLFDHYPEWASVIPEVARQLSPDSLLIPNAKNLYVRLLAETGLPGFWLFFVFMVSFLGIIRRQLQSGIPLLRFVAAAGLFAWLGLALRNLTQDSLTFPIMWVTLGMIVGLAPTSFTEN